MESDNMPGEEMEVVGHAIRLDGVASIVAASTAADNVGGLGQHVDKLALAFIAPLSAKHNFTQRHCCRTTISTLASAPVENGGAKGEVGR